MNFPFLELQWPGNFLYSFNASANERASTADCHIQICCICVSPRELRLCVKFAYQTLPITLSVTSKYSLRSGVCSCTRNFQARLEYQQVFSSVWTNEKDMKPSRTSRSAESSRHFCSIRIRHRQPFYIVKPARNDTPTDHNTVPFNTGTYFRTKILPVTYSMHLPSSVSIVTRLRLNNRGSIPSRVSEGIFISSPPRPDQLR
jgi:hypothetical protein